ncbi:SMR family transporter [Gordonia sp. CPCC 205515]|uniref:DMT family transporter n=1 Tax=Gordonia sp. CPCC 205515 TaxID=3140791 RepID=UPI003AF3EA34
MKWLILAGAIVYEVAASLSLKGSENHPWLYVVVAVGYLVAFGCLALVLKLGMPLGAAYGIWGAMGVALTALFSTLLFDEAFTPLMGIGLILIVGGVLLVETGSKSHQSHSETTEYDESMTR